jgi:hypothetical protein
MKKISLVLYSTLILFILCQQKIYAQNKSDAYLKLIGEKMFITTLGDAPGYSAGTEINKFISSVFNIGIDYRFGSALRAPYFYHSFYHKSVSYLEAEIAYYPFNKKNSFLYSKILRGLNAKTGPSFFYGQFSQEAQWVSTINPATGEETDRVSRLKLIRTADFGYHVIISYEAYLGKKIFIGANVNFANYKNNDGYSSYGLSAGFKL